MANTSKTAKNWAFTIFIKRDNNYELGSGARIENGILYGIDAGGSGPRGGERKDGERDEAGRNIDADRRIRSEAASDGENERVEQIIGGGEDGERGFVRDRSRGRHGYEWGELVRGTGGNNPLGISTDGTSVAQWIYQLENCSQSSRIHFQGYIRFRRPVRMSGVKKILRRNDAHIESTKGSTADNIRYCSKSESRILGPWAGGDDVQQGKRTDLDSIANAIRESKLTVSSIREQHPEMYCRYRSGLKDLCGDAAKLRAREFRKLRVVVIHGAAGVGKTRRAVDTANERGCGYYILDHSGEGRLWFDGYDGEELLIIDDFYGWIKWHQFLRILDGYQMRLEIKGGFTYALWDTVFITSNKPPDMWYERGMPPELQRRITEIIHME